MSRADHHTKPARSLCASALVLTLLTACAGTPQSNPRLVEATQAYRTASVDPRVAQRGAVELRAAERDLAEAERMLAKGAGVEVVDHYAYLASQRTAIAVEKGRQAEADEAIEAAQKQRSQTVIAARTDEADRARLQAEARAREAEEALARARAAEAQLAELQATKSERGMVLTLGDVLFDTGRAELRSGAMRTVDQLATFMQSYPERNVIVEGHTDNVGAADFNQRLSEQRAEAVREALLVRGIASNRVRVRGFGYSYPVASNASAEGRQRNRRVEVIISDETGRILER